MESFSVWPRCNASFETLTKDIETEVVIVGAGIAGLTIAYCLKQKGFRPIIVDAGTPGMGETHHTTAHLASVIDDRFFNIEKWHGEEGSQAAFESHAAAIDFIEKTSEELKINCDFKRVDAFLFANNTEETEDLKKEFEASQRAGHRDAEWLEENPLPRSNKYPSIKFKNQAQFNPGKYINGLLKVLKEDIKIYSGCRILSWSEKDQIILKTSDDHKITCNKVIFATNDPYVRLTYYTMHTAYRSYALAFNLKDQDAIPEALYWDMNDPYHYVRFGKYKDEKVLIVGGEDHRTGQKNNAKQAWTNLERWSRKNFPFIDEQVTQWSGQILETIDGLGLIGADFKSSEKVFLVSGDSGMGLTHGTIAGMLIADIISKEHQLTAWAKIYDPGRFRWGALRIFLEENLKTNAQYLHYLCPVEHNYKDEGEVIQKGLHKVARPKVDGEVNELTAVCPHLGGLMRWNNAEQTWDCECHGSRFTAEGKVLNGPAVENLEHVEA
jgi:glycine/D-amino acid oxidase-like deaminating enzyme